MGARTSLGLVLVSVLAASCGASSYDGHGVTWKLPRGVSMESEGTAPGATAMVQFSGGVVIRTYALEGMPTDADEQHLEDISKKVLPAGVTPISKRGGTLPAGKVARFVWTEGPNRTLLYYLPGKSQVTVISLTAPESRFSSLENHFDLSLSTLRVR
jgi:hypothetical protein